MSETTPGSWQPDPYGRFAQRYWDGANWTENVIDASGGQTTDAPVPSAGGTFGAATTSGSAVPVPGLVVAGAGLLMVLLSAFVLTWFDFNSENKADLRGASAAEKRLIEAESGLSVDDLLDGLKLSELRDILDAGGGEDLSFLEEQYVKWGYLVAVAAAAFALAALFAKNLRTPAIVVAIVMTLWHAGVAYSLGNDDATTQIGAWLGAIGLVACAVAPLLPRPNAAA